MSLNFRFQKESLWDGSHAARPIIPILISGERAVTANALIDSGSDVTVIPGTIAAELGLPLDGKKNRLFAYRESCEVIESKARISFRARKGRESINLDVPVLIDMEGSDDDVVLGIAGIFDFLDISFMKSRNRITLKRAA